MPTMLMIVRYMLGYGNAATNDPNASPSPRAASMLSTVLGAVMLWSLAAERPSFLYAKPKPRHSPVSQALIDNYERCGYHDCNRLYGMPSYFDRDLMAWYVRQHDALAAKAEAVECQSETEWLAGLAELTSLTMHDGTPIVLTPPCPIEQEQ